MGECNSSIQRVEVLKYSLVRGRTPVARSEHRLAAFAQAQDTLLLPPPTLRSCDTYTAHPLMEVKSACLGTWKLCLWI